MEAVASAQNKYFKLEVFSDEDCGSPREYDNLGTFITWDRGYRSPDANDYNEPTDFMREWLPSTADKCPDCGNDGVTPMTLSDHEPWSAGTISPIVADPSFGVPAIYECSWCGHGWGPSDGRGAGGVFLPFFKYEHGGVAYSTGEFADPWDSGQVGFIYTTAEDIARTGPVDGDVEWMAKHHEGKTLIEVVTSILQAEVEEYSKWANGECFGYVLSEWTGNYDGEDRYEEIDTCWGFIGGDVANWGLGTGSAPAPLIDELTARIVL